MKDLIEYLKVAEGVAGVIRAAAERQTLQQAVESLAWRANKLTTDINALEVAIKDKQKRHAQAEQQFKQYGTMQDRTRRIKDPDKMVRVKTQDLQKANRAFDEFRQRIDA